MTEILLALEDLDLEQRLVLYGPQDAYLQVIEKVYNVKIEEEGDALVTHSDTDQASNLKKTFGEIKRLIVNGFALDPVTVRKVAEKYLDHGEEKQNENLFEKPLGRSFDHKLIYPKSYNQKQLYKTLEEKDMTFVIGPAGTGKTFISVLYAVNLLKNDKVKRIIITRPVVEAGESLGYLPGDLEEKIDPYLRPIYDALDELVSPAARMHLMEKGTIEIAPLAYMRGRTLDDAAIILDEAQNTTAMQMKMFLTRMGFHSKMIITGDMTQVDLPAGKRSGMADAVQRLREIDEIGFVELSAADVVRHPLIRKILARYEEKQR